MDLFFLLNITVPAVTAPAAPAADVLRLVRWILIKNEPVGRNHSSLCRFSMELAWFLLTGFEFRKNSISSYDSECLRSFVFSSVSALSICFKRLTGWNAACMSGLAQLQRHCRLLMLEAGKSYDLMKPGRMKNSLFFFDVA